MTDTQNSDADADTIAVRRATTDVNKLIQNWAEATDEVRRDYWRHAAESNDALFDRFHDRFADLDRRATDTTPVADRG